MSSNNNLISRHLHNLARLSYIFEDTTRMLENHLERNNNQSRNRRFQFNNNLNTDTNNLNDPTVLFRFDTLIPNLFDNLNNLNQTTDNSFSILVIDENNRDIINDNSNNYDISSNYDILDIEKYEYITEPINDICPITRERFHNEQNVLMIRTCKHIFNKSSLNRWLTNHNTCPNCRTVIRSRVLF